MPDDVAVVASTVTTAFVDGGYGGQCIEHGAGRGIDVTVVR